MGFPEIGEQFRLTLSTLETPIARYRFIAARLSEYFGVALDEVALFKYDRTRRMLVFIWPDTLKTAGNIPIDAPNCLMASTALHGQAVLDNAFVSTPHLHLFERLVAEHARQVAIQKIMSAPISDPSGLVGVVQIARKGATPASAGPDFTPGNLEDLAGFAGMLAASL